MIIYHLGKNNHIFINIFFGPKDTHIYLHRAYMHMKKKVRLNVSIEQEQAAFLEAHPEINASGLMRNAIDEYMRIHAHR